MVLEEKQAYRSMGHNWKPEIKSYVYGQILTKKTKTYNGEKEGSSMNGARKIKKDMQKNELGLLLDLLFQK